jgi:glycosyltransferase involved in cell wall biosynthesis
MNYQPSDVTVGVRAFNRPKFLEVCLNSIREQSISGFNVIVVDDSQDPNAANENQRVCADYKVSYIKPNKHLRLGGRTLNYVLNYTNTDLISFIDDDDFWHKRKLELQLQKLNTDPKIGLVTCSQENFTTDKDQLLKKEKIIRKNIPAFQNLLHMSGKYLGPPSAVMVKSSIIRELGGFNEAIPRGPCQLLFRKISKNYKIVACQETLLFYRVHEKSITGAFGGFKDKDDVQSRLMKLQELNADFDRNLKQRYLEEKAILKLILRGVGDDDMLILLRQLGSNLKIFRPILIRAAKILWKAYNKKNG